MPYYTFRKPGSKATKTVFQSMNEPHVYAKNGETWMRVYERPQMSVDSHVDPLDKKQFKSKTINKRGTLGDLWDQSRELSRKRSELLGFDPVEEKFYAKHKSDYKITHPSELKRELNKNLKKKGIQLKDYPRHDAAC